MSLLLVQFCAEAAEVLGVFGILVGGFAGEAFAFAFFVVEAFAVLFGPSGGWG